MYNESVRSKQKGTDIPYMEAYSGKHITLKFITTNYVNTCT